jgi:hypothetical protein
VQTSWAVYRRLNGVQIGQFRQTPASVRSDQALFDEAGVISRFHQRQWIAIPGNDDDFVEFALVLNEFEDSDSALVALSDWSNSEVATPTAGFSAIEAVPGATTFGDVSRTYTFQFDRGEAGIASGYRYYIQAGPMLIVFHVMSLAGPDLAIIDEIATAVAACAVSSSGCESIEVPAGLLETGGSGGGSDLA